MRILLVEDEQHIAEALAKILQNNKYTVDVVHNGDDGLDYALSNVYDVILLDIMLPKRSGLEVLEEFRKKNKTTPVIMLTARGEVSDKITGLDLGADDYIPKPFNSDELLARIRAASRRKNEIVSLNRIFTFEDISLNAEILVLSCETESITLTLKESMLLEYFICNNEIILSKDKIIEKIWGYDSDAADNNVEVYISFLRKKLQYVNSKTGILTVKGLGYKLCLKN
ncbi:MAG: response regulator transcription factor [Eubacteriales bacterium]